MRCSLGRAEKQNAKARWQSPASELLGSQGERNPVCLVSHSAQPSQTRARTRGQELASRFASPHSFHLLCFYFVLLLNSPYRLPTRLPPQGCDCSKASPPIEPTWTTLVSFQGSATWVQESSLRCARTPKIPVALALALVLAVASNTDSPVLQPSLCRPRTTDYAVAYDQLTLEGRPQRRLRAIPEGDIPRIPILPWPLERERRGLSLLPRTTMIASPNSRAPSAALQASYPRE